MKIATTASQGGQSLSGLLAMLISAGAIFAAWKFPLVIEGWSTLARYVGLIGAFLLFLWGIDRQLPDVRSAITGRRHRRARHTVVVPRQGAMCLVILVALLTGSMIGRSNMLMLVFTMVAGPFVVNGWIIFSMLKRLGVERRVPKRTMAGEPAVVELTLKNGKRFLSNWLMSAADNIENSTERLNTGVLFSRVPAHSQRTGNYQVRLMQRGTYRFGPVHVTTRFPLGLVERGLLFDLRDEILVHPRLGRLSSSWKREHLLAADLVQQRQLRRGAFDDEFHRIREYRWGDNPRAIHWRTSARHSQLMVRQYRQSRDRDLVLILDLWAPSKPTSQERERVELAMSLAATICIEHMRDSRDSKISVFVAGRTESRWEGETAPAFRDSLLDLLAVVEPGSSPALVKLFDDAAAKRSPGTAVLLVSSRDRSAAMTTFDQALAGRSAGDLLGDVQVLTSDPRELTKYFEMV